MRRSNGSKDMSVACLIELLKQVDPDARVQVNEVKNLLVWKMSMSKAEDEYETLYVGYIDFNDETLNKFPTA